MIAGMYSEFQIVISSAWGLSVENSFLHVKKKTIPVCK
jgi:hypothetical protein